MHLVLGAHPRDIRAVVGHLKSRATRKLKQEGLLADADRPLWGEHGWNIALETEQAVWRAIRYVERNPLKEGKKPQRWSFVIPFHLDAAIEDARMAGRNRVQRRIGGAALRSHEEKAAREPEKGCRERRG